MGIREPRTNPLEPYCQNPQSDFTEAHPVTLIEAWGLIQKRTMDERAIGAPTMKMDNA